MSYKFLDLSGLQRFLTKLKVIIPTKTSDLTNDSNFTTADSALSGTSTNAIQNKVVKDALDGKANSSHTHGNSDITSLDASKITSGTIDIARLPAGALERLVTVADQTARFALTVNDVQLGDTVKQLDTGVMYIVTDVSKLSQADGYTEYTAGSATSVPWSGVTGKPSDYTPSSHTHGNVTNDGKLGTASKVVISDSNKLITTSSVTDTELGYLSGVTSSVQTQINAKADDSGVVHTTGNESISGTKSFNSDLNLNYASTDVDDIVDSIPGLGTVEDYVHISGAETISGVKTFSDGIVANVSGTATPLSHTHGNLTNDGKIGTTANKPVITGTNGVLTAGAFGTSANTFCEGNDSRLSDARTPVSHSHGSISNDGKLANGNKVVITNSSKVITESSVTDTELGYLSGVTSSVQTQISTNDSNAVHITGNESISGTKSFNSDLNLNYANTDVDDIVDSTPGTGTSDIFVHNTGAETISGVKTFSDGIVANVSGNCTKDGNGNVITSTYGALSANNTWTGINTFSSATYGEIIRLKNTSLDLSNGNPSVSSACNHMIWWDDKNNTHYAKVQAWTNNNSTAITLTSYFRTDANTVITSNLRNQCGDSSKAFFPDSNGDTDLGISTNKWKSIYSDSYYYGTTKWGLDQANVWTGRQTYGAYLTSFGEARTDEWSVNSRTNAYLLSRRDTDEVSGFLISTFRQNTEQGVAGHIYGWDILENSTRYSGLRFTIEWDNTLNSGNGAYKVTLGTNTQGTNPCNDLHITQLKTINGVNPGALSLPNLDSDGYTDLSGNISANSEYLYTPAYDGWLALYCQTTGFHAENAIGIFSREGSTNSYRWANTVTSSINLLRLNQYQGSVILPVRAGIQYGCWVVVNSSTSLASARLFFYKAKGTV